MTETALKPRGARFSLSEIRYRATLSDIGRRKTGEIPADSDIHHLLGILEDVRDELENAIDGGEECRGYDSWLSGLIRMIDGEKL